MRERRLEIPKTPNLLSLDVATKKTTISVFNQMIQGTVIELKPKEKAKKYEILFNNVHV